MNISEELEFMTQIHTSWNNTEQRAALRCYPRRNVTYEYIGIEDEQSQYLRALSYAQQNTQIEVPLWHAAYKIPYTIYKDSYDITIPTNLLWQYRGAQKIIFWISDKKNGLKHAIKAFYADGNIKLTKPLLNKYSPNYIHVMPYTTSILSQQNKFSSSDSLHSSMELEYELIQNYTTIPIPESFNEFHYEPCDEFSRWINPKQTNYNNLEIFMAAPDWTSDISVDYKRNANRLDNNYGYFRFDIKSANPTETKELPYTAITREEINNIQRFFCRCKGMLKAFYAPTWLSDLELVEDAKKGQNYLIVKFPYYWKYYTTGDRRKTIIAFTKTGAPIIIKIAAYTIDDTGVNGKVMLEAPLTSSLIKKDILMLSYLCKYRFNSDSLVTNYETQEIATFKLPFMEVDA